MVRNSFEIGDLVWAKMKGYPVWPGEITVPPAGTKVKKAHHYVFFYGSNNCAWIPDDKIELHDESLVENFSRLKKKPSGLMNAVQKIVDASNDASKYLMDFETSNEISTNNRRSMSPNAIHVEEREVIKKKQCDRKNDALEDMDNENEDVSVKSISPNENGIQIKKEGREAKKKLKNYFVKDYSRRRASSNEAGILSLETTPTKKKKNDHIKDIKMQKKNRIDVTEKQKHSEIFATENQKSDKITTFNNQKEYEDFSHLRPSDSKAQDLTPSDSGAEDMRLSDSETEDLRPTDSGTEDLKPSEAEDMRQSERDDLKHSDSEIQDLRHSETDNLKPTYLEDLRLSDSETEHLRHSDSDDLRLSDSETEFLRLPHSDSETEFLRLPNSDSETEFLRLPNSDSETEYLRLPDSDSEMEYLRVPHSISEADYLRQDSETEDLRPLYFDSETRYMRPLYLDSETLNLRPQYSEQISNDLRPQHSEQLSNDLRPHHSEQISNDLRPQYSEQISNDLRPQYSEQISNDLTSQYSEQISSESEVDINPSILFSPSNYEDCPESPSVDVNSENDILKLKNITPTKKKIGFLGLGRMGQRMVKNLIQSGHSVTVWNRTTIRCETCNGAETAQTPADVVIACDIIFSCMSDAAVSKRVFFMSSGVSSGLKAAAIAGDSKGFVEMTSLDPNTSKTICQDVNINGSRYLEAQINGTKQQADDGTLLILVAGERSLFEECNSCFCAIGKDCMFISPTVGVASSYNIIHNMLRGTVYAALAESFALIESIGIKKKDFIEMFAIVEESTIVKLDKNNAMGDTESDIDIPLRHVQKSLSYALELGSSVKQPMFVTSAANEAYKHCKLLKYANHDISAAYEGARK